MDRRERLEALRDRLTEALAGAEPRAMAGISRELRLTLAELEGIPTPGRVSARDEIAAARALRREAAGVPERPVKSVKRGG